MDCSKTRELLSAYHDGELSPELHSSVTEHVPGCSHCTEELDVFEEVSVMAKRLADPKPPERLWRQIESELDAGTENAAIDVHAARRGHLSPWTKSCS